MRPDAITALRARRFSRRAAAGSLAASVAFTRLPGAVAQNSATPAAADVSIDWTSLDQQAAAAAPDVALLAAELVDGQILPVHALNADLVLPVGSSFKLWILGALARQVETGALDWEQAVEIEDRYRSVPGGDLRYVAAGTTFTLRYLAERMIQKSDNTATDHLLFTAGRENVEAMMTTMGVADPSRNIPLISTRELAMMKFAYPTAKLDAYYAASIDARRRLLAEEIDTIPYEALTDLEQEVPVEIERVEWFATRNDLASTMAWLQAAAPRPGLLPVGEILSLETQLPFDGETWPYVGFKGGSEMGVLSGTWLMRRADDRWFVSSVGFRDPDAALNMDTAIAVMATGRDLLGKTP